MVVPNKKFFFKNAPIKKSIEDLLVWEEYHEGVWKSKKGYYIKITSDLYPPVVKILVKDYKRRRYAVKDALRCAKVYKKLTKAGMYPPKTEFIVYENSEDVLSLLVVMPKVDTLNASGDVKKKLKSVQKKLHLKNVYWGDVLWTFNWGCDDKGNLYCHDLHIADDYTQILDLAKKMRIK